MTTRYVTKTTITRVFEHTKKIHVGGFGNDAVFEDRSAGWYITMRGSYEALHVGAERPELAPGDPVKITVERASPDDRSYCDLVGDYVRSLEDRSR